MYFLGEERMPSPKRFMSIEMRINFWQQDTVHADPAVVEYQEAPVADAVAYRRETVSGQSLRYATLTRLMLYVGIFLVPLFFLPWTTSMLELSKQALLVVVAGVALITWLLGVVVSGQLRYRSGALDKAMLAMLIATVVATVFSLSPAKSMFGISISLSDSLISIAALTIIYFLIVNVVDRGAMLQSVLVGSIGLALLFGLLQMLNIHLLGFDFAHSRAFTTVGSLNALGILAAVALPLFMKTRIAPPRLPYLDFAKLSLAVALAILIILNWWVLWAVAIIGMLAIIALDSVSQALGGRSRFSMARFLAPMIIIVLAAFLMIVQFKLTVVKRNLPVEVGPSFSLSNRIIGNILGKNILTGYGPENFSVAFDQFGAKALANSTLSDVKFFDGMSQAQTMVAQSGVLGALAIVMLVAMGGYALTRFPTIAAGGGATTAVLAAATAGMAAFFLHPFNLTLSLVFFALLGLISAATTDRAWRLVNIEERPAFSLASSLGFIVALITVLTGGYFITVHYLADVDFARAQTEKDNTAAAQRLVTAINWHATDRYYRSASQVTLAMLGQEIRKNDRSSDRMTRIQNLIVSARDLATQATKLEPKESNNWFNLGTVYESLVGIVADADTLAQEAYLKAAELRPGDASFANRIGSMYLNKTDLEYQQARSNPGTADQFNRQAQAALLKADEYFKKAIALSPNYGLAIYNLAAVYDRQGKVTDAIKQIEKIAPFNAGDPNIMFQLGLLYYRADRKNDAFAAMEKAVFLNPSFANARWYLGLLYEERKEFPNAIAQMEKILETNADNETVLKKIDDLRQGISQFPPGKVTDEKPL